MMHHVPPPGELGDNEPDVNGKDNTTSQLERVGGRAFRRRSLPFDLTLSIAIGTAFVIGILPIILYVFLFATLPTVTAPEARQRLATAGAKVALVDIRDPATFALGHVEGATNWPYQKILQLDPADALPEELIGKELILICDTGLQSAWATRRLLELSLAVSHVHGGMQSWISTSAKDGGDEILWQQGISGEAGFLPTRVLKPTEQLATATASVLIKPAYMVITLLFIIVLWSSRAADLAALRWGLMFFLAGEISCVFNTVAYFTTGEQSDLFEYLHGLGMVFFLGLIIYALLDGFDRRVIHVTQAHRRCALLPLCRSCYKTHDAPCGMKRVFMLITPAIAALVFIPLSARPDGTSFNASLFGVPFNFSHPGIHQFFEIRYLPIVALGSLGVTLSILLFRKKDPIVLARIPFSAGIGTLGYSLLMLVLYAVFRDNLVWFIFWEEGTELVLIAAIGAMLWVFRRGLFPPVS